MGLMGGLKEQHNKIVLKHLVQVGRQPGRFVGNASDTANEAHQLMPFAVDELLAT